MNIIFIFIVLIFKKQLRKNKLKKGNENEEIYN